METGVCRQHYSMNNRLNLNVSYFTDKLCFSVLFSVHNTMLAANLLLGQLVVHSFSSRDIFFRCQYCEKQSTY